MVDPATLGTIANIGFGALGLGSGRKAAKMQRRIAKEDRNVAGTAYEPINFYGLGGAGLTFGGGGAGGGGYAAGDYSGTLGGPRSGRIQDLGGGYRRIGRYTLQSDINQAQLGLGDLGFAREQLMGMDPFSGAGAFTQDLGLSQAFGGLGQMYGGMDALNAMSPQVQQAFQGAANQRLFNQRNPFAQRAMTSYMGLGRENLERAAGSYDTQYQDALSRLRESARPGEELAGANFLQRMFDTGGRGTSGGAMQSEAFARALANAETDRQLQAYGEARAQRQSDLGTGQALLGAGMGLRGLQDSLMQNATSRFGAMANLNQGLAQARFGMGQDLGQYGVGLYGLGMQQNQAPYQQFGQWLGALSGLQDYAMVPAEFGERLMSNQAAYRTGQAGVGSQGLNAVNANNASMFGQLAGADWGGMFEKLGGLFGGGGNA